jgi:hypothetical protein
MHRALKEDRPWEKRKRQEGKKTMAKGAIFGLETATIAVVVLLLLLNYKINPTLLILAGAVIGVLSLKP